MSKIVKKSSQSKKISKKKASKKSKKLKFGEDEYEKMTHHEHVLELPDTYIGSIELDTKEMWIHDAELDKIVKRDISFVPGLYKIYDEILVNARDHCVRKKNCRYIKVDIGKDNITVTNGGDGIPVKIHEKEGIYNPELIFGHLLTSGNYKQTGKIVGGKNGYGSTCCNIYSTHFYVETLDANRHLLYKQHFHDNMYTIKKPKIEEVGKKEKPYTKVQFWPDFSKFGVEGFTEDIISLFRKRVYDLAACTNSRIKVYLDGKLLDVTNFASYIQKHYDYESEESTASQPIYEVSDNRRWRVGAVYDPSSGYQHVSYVNGICTYKGGSHVNHVVEQIVNGLQEFIKKKNKKITVKNAFIKDNLTIFIDSVIEDPSFDSQTKEFCSSKVSNFGSRYEVSDDFIKDLSKSGIIDMVLEFAKMKEMASMKKSDGQKRTSLRGLAKLKDADWAGGRKSKQCKLILTEGDSAKTFAINGLAVVGHEKYGVFPLRGKLLNAREASAKTLLKNEEIKNIKQIMGLKHGKVYKDLSKLRYGGIIILTDQDLDGSHIKGLIINFLHFFWPSLIKLENFVQYMPTPLKKAWKKTDTKKKNMKIFYTQSEYDKWAKKADVPKWNEKYYKGLGTHSDKEARDCFEDFEKRIISYGWDQNPDEVVELDDKEDETSEETAKEEDYIADISNKSYQAILLAFAKTNADKRKTWLGEYNPNNIVDNSVTRLTYEDFVHKELKHFSNYDNVRSLPSICDGLKPSQRKILHTAITRKILKKEIKVAQLSGYVSAETEYHHGEESLQGAIVGMAQAYVGSNNINVLNPNGSFGSRQMGGKDAASARYIYTQLNKLTPLLFRKEDEIILKYQEEEGNMIEPIVYFPILPLVLINGCEGIGTGYSTNIPCFNPEDIIKNIERIMKGKELKSMIPWYRGFTGKITKEKGNFRSFGKTEIIDSTTLKISELPVGVWTQKYKEDIESLIIDDPKKAPASKILTDLVDHCETTNIDFTLKFKRGALQDLIKSNGIEKKLKLSKPINITNMHLFNAEGQIKKYTKPNDILREWYEFRLKTYEARKAQYLKVLENNMLLMKYRIKFINYIIKDKIIIKKKKKVDIISKLEQNTFPKLCITYGKGEPSYNYLTDLPLFSLTEEKMDEYNNKLKQTEDEFETYKNTTCEEIWIGEIKEFHQEYNKWTKDMVELDKELNKSKKTTKPKRTRKKRKDM